MRRINLPEIGEQLPLFQMHGLSYQIIWSVIYPIICIHVCIYIYPQPWPPNKIQIVILIINSSLFGFLLIKSCKILIFMSMKPVFFLGEFPHDPHRQVPTPWIPPAPFQRSTASVRGCDPSVAGRWWRRWRCRNRAPGMGFRPEGNWVSLW